MKTYYFSLCQFFLILSGRDGEGFQARTRTQGGASTTNVNSTTPKEAKFWTQDVFSVITEMFLQDLPFAVVRISAIVVYRVFQYSLMFFTVKNILLLCLQMYRLCVLYDEYNKDLEKLDSWIHNQEDTEKNRDLKQNKMLQLLSSINESPSGIRKKVKNKGLV